MDILDNWATPEHAIQLIHQHGHKARVNGDYLEGNSDGHWEELAKLDPNGFILIGHVEMWLGY